MSWVPPGAVSLTISFDLRLTLVNDENVTVTEHESDGCSVLPAHPGETVKWLSSALTLMIFTWPLPVLAIFTFVDVLDGVLPPVNSPRYTVVGAKLSWPGGCPRPLNRACAATVPSGVV